MLPLVIVNVSPTFEQTPSLLYATDNPELAVAATVKLPANTLLAGAGVVIEID
jgi:hypothetical protein